MLRSMYIGTCALPHTLLTLVVVLMSTAVWAWGSTSSFLQKDDTLLVEKKSRLTS